MGQSYARLARTSIAVALVAAALAACAGRATPAVATATRTLVAEAEERERARRYDQARVLYERAERGAPDAHSRAWVARRFARALVFWGEYEAAEAELAVVIELRPDDAPSWHDLGILRHRRGDTAGAEQALRRAVALAPREPRPRVALAALLVSARRYPEAIAEYRALLDLDLPERTRRAVGEALELLHRQAAAPR